MGNHLIFGASGAIGGQIVEAISAIDGAHIIAISRRDLPSVDQSTNWYCDLDIESSIADVCGKIDSTNDIESITFCQGALSEGHFLTTDPDKFQRVLNVNFVNTVRIVQKIARKMAGQRRGRIVFIGSSVTARMHTGNLAYATSKYAIVGFCRGLAIELKRFGVGVYVVSPGLVESELARKTIERTRNVQSRYELTLASDVAAEVARLISSDSINLTGQNLYVNFAMDHL